MKKVIAALLLFVGIGYSAKAQINAVTEDGDQVFLYNDGTWKYKDEDFNKDLLLELNEKAFEKDNSATFLLKSKRTKFGFWIDPKAWKISGENYNDFSEYEFKDLKGDAYSMAIVEGLTTTTEHLKDYALAYMLKAAPDMKVIHQEYRIVNGLKVIFMEARGTVNGMNLTYLGYYYSTQDGSVQFTVFSGTDSVSKNKEEYLKLLNGLVSLK